MIEYRNGDLLTQEDIQIRGHQVNCKGVWGSGIAYQIKQKYPECFPFYNSLCNEHKEKMLGEVLFCKCNDGTILANLFGQNEYGIGKRRTDYNALKKAIAEVHDYASENNLTVGFPVLMGCDRGGGDWNIVLGFIKEYFENSPVKCILVKY